MGGQFGKLPGTVQEHVMSNYAVVRRAGRAEAEQGSLGDATRLMTSALSYYEAAAEQDSDSIQLLVGSPVSLLRSLLLPCCILPSSCCPSNVFSYCN